MTRNPDNPQQRLEALLRQWGAGEAIQDVSIPEPPRVQTRRESGWLVRWAPALAAAMLLLTAGILFYGAWRTGQRFRPDRLAGVSPGPDPKTEKILTRLDRLEKKFQDQPDALQAEATPPAASIDRPEDGATGQAVRRMAAQADSLPAGGAPAIKASQPAEPPAPDRLVDLQKKLRDQQERLNQVEASQARGRQALARLAEVQQELDRKDSALDRMREEKQSLAGKVELARRRHQDLAEQVRRLEARLGEQNSAPSDAGRAIGSRKRGVRAKTAQTAGLADDADLAGVDETETVPSDPTQLAALRRRLDALDRQHRQLRESFEIAYRSSMAPGQTGLDAWQTVVTRSRLIERSARAGQDSSSARTRKLVEQIEFVLTRLSLTDPQQPRAGENLARWIAQRKLIEAIDRTLAGGEEIDRLNAWMLEARAVLKGILDVG